MQWKRTFYSAVKIWNTNNILKQRYFSYSSNHHTAAWWTVEFLRSRLWVQARTMKASRHVWISSTGWAQRLRPLQQSYDLSSGSIALRSMPLQQAMSLTWTFGAKVVMRIRRLCLWSGPYGWYTGWLRVVVYEGRRPCWCAHKWVGAETGCGAALVYIWDRKVRQRMIVQYTRTCWINTQAAITIILVATA